MELDRLVDRGTDQLIAKSNMYGENPDGYETDGYDHREEVKKQNRRDHAEGSE